MEKYAKDNNVKVINYFDLHFKIVMKTEDGVDKMEIKIPEN